MSAIALYATLDIHQGQDLAGGLKAQAESFMHSEPPNRSGRNCRRLGIPKLELYFLVLFSGTQNILCDHRIVFEPADQGNLVQIGEIDVRNRCNRANHHSDEPARTFCWPTVRTSRKQ